MPGVARANLAVRFLCELAALASLAVWGAGTGNDPAVHVLLGITAPLLLAMLWGVFVAPRAPRRLPDPARAGLEILVFGAAVAALIDVGQPLLGALLGLLAAVSGALVRVWPEPVGEPPG